MADINTIKNWFKTNLKPTQAQFWATWDSFWHKDEKIPVSSVDQLQDFLDQKAERQGLEGHIANKDNPHNVTKEQLGLEFVDNTSDVDKPISDAAKEALENCKSKAESNFIPSGAVEDNYILLDKESSKIVVTEHTFLSGIIIESGAKPYPGKEIMIINEQDTFLKLDNSNDGDITYFSLPKNEPYYMMPGECVTFYLSEDLDVLYFLSSNRARGTKVINSNTIIDTSFNDCTVYIMASCVLTFDLPANLIPSFEAAFITNEVATADFTGNSPWVINAPDGKHLPVNSMCYAGRVKASNTIFLTGDLELS